MISKLRRDPERAPGSPPRGACDVVPGDDRERGARPSCILEDLARPRMHQLPYGRQSDAIHLRVLRCLQEESATHADRVRTLSREQFPGGSADPAQRLAAAHSGNDRAHPPFPRLCRSAFADDERSASRSLGQATTGAALHRVRSRALPVQSAAAARCSATVDVSARAEQVAHAAEEARARARALQR